jgi:hypothetical protein
VRLGIVFPPVCVRVYRAFRDIAFLQKYRLVIL